MLDALKFCSGSVAKKDLLPALTHFVIEHGKVRGFNGVMALCSPIPFDISCKPKADKLIKAIASCEETVALSLTPTGKLSVKSGKFRTLIECVDGLTVHTIPEGEHMPIDGEALLAGLKAVAPFIGDDASRRWTNGVLIDQQSLFATNNVILVQYWMGINFPRTINLPRDAVNEMVRIGKPPVAIQLAENSITFHYENERWLRTQLFDHTAWPDLNKILNAPSNQSPMPEGFAKALSVVKPFVDKIGTVIFQQQRIVTHEDESEGASFDLPDLIGEEGRYNVTMLELLAGTAKTIDWTTYPKPCLFSAGRLRGAIIGMRPL